MWKDRDKVPAATGLPDAAPRPGKSDFLEVWAYDEHGSFNAVSAFLQQLGVRWLLPGELGEIVPRTSTIALPKIDKTVRPDFEIRQFSVHGPSQWTRWGMRLGVRYPYAMHTAHGMSRLGRQEIFDAHPDWFAMYGGKRQFDPDDNRHHFCYSNEELFQAAVRCVRAQFDVYDFEGVSVMPRDAYTSICQCPLCEGKDDPDRGPRGSLSNHVWDFVNRVAKEVAKTHPHKLIYCCAYGTYSLPPTNIDKLEPNVQVVIVGGRRPKSGAAKQPEIRAFRASWLPKTDRPIQVYENYPLTNRGWYLPCFMARTIGHSINETKGISRGEEVWISPHREFDELAAFDAFQFYFTARMYWGGKEQNVEALFDEYCRLLYGPAGETMKRFFDYCEFHWQDMETDKAKADAALGLFDEAKAKLEPSSIEARRLALLDEFLNGLRTRSVQLGQRRGVVPKLRLVRESKDIVIDGCFDEPFWKTINAGSVGSLRELQTGRAPALGAKVMTGWYRDSLYFAIRCDEMPGEKPNITADKHDDMAIWYGDVVEILLETNMHSYYQIAVNPGGSVVDLDRGMNKSSALNLGFAGRSRHAAGRRPLDGRDPYSRNRRRERPAAPGRGSQTDTESAVARQHLPSTHAGKWDGTISFLADGNERISSSLELRAPVCRFVAHIRGRRDRDELPDGTPRRGKTAEGRGLDGAGCPGRRVAGQADGSPAIACVETSCRRGSFVERQCPRRSIGGPHPDRSRTQLCRDAQPARQT